MDAVLLRINKTIEVAGIMNKYQPGPNTKANLADSDSFENTLLAARTRLFISN